MIHRIYKKLKKLNSNKTKNSLKKYVSEADILKYDMYNFPTVKSSNYMSALWYTVNYHYLKEMYKPKYIFRLVTLIASVNSHLIVTIEIILMRKIWHTLNY